jgi:hypothetical protein
MKTQTGTLIAASLGLLLVTTSVFTMHFYVLS